MAKGVTLDQIRELITAVGLERYATQIMSMLQPGIAIHTTKSDDSLIPVGQSKFGGMPDLPPTISWPDYQGRPLDFAAQINLADVTQYDHEHLLPEWGRLYFFYDPKQWMTGLPDELNRYAVYYDDTNCTQLLRANAPPGLEGNYVACTLSYSKELTLPSFPSIQLAKLGWTYEEKYSHDIDSYYDLRERVSQLFGRKNCDDIQHLIFGHPNIIQGDVMVSAEQALHDRVLQQNVYKKYEANILNWQLLMQIDSDRNADMRWGSMGRLYYCIQTSDLHQQRFDKVVCVLQDT